MFVLIGLLLNAAHFSDDTSVTSSYASWAFDCCGPIPTTPPFGLQTESARKWPNSSPTPCVHQFQHLIWAEASRLAQAQFITRCRPFLFLTLHLFEGFLLIHSVRVSTFLLKRNPPISVRVSTFLPQPLVVRTSC